MSILNELGFLGCLTVMSPKSVSFHGISSAVWRILTRCGTAAIAGSVEHGQDWHYVLCEFLARRGFQERDATQALVVSTAITIGGTAVSLAGSTMLAYALSRTGTFAQRPMLMIVLLSLLFSPGLIPNYLVVKQFGLLDSLWALILPSAISGFDVIVLRSFMMAIPKDVTDSARIDGAGDFRIFLHIVLPLSKAVLAMIGLFYAVGYWNAFFNAMLYISDSGKWPLQLIPRTYVVNNPSSRPRTRLRRRLLPPQPSIQTAILVVSLVPILIVYPFLQRQFAKGTLTGSVKG